MSDDKQKTGPADAARVNASESYEVTYWAKKFGVTRDELVAAAKAAGPMAKDVEAHLKKKA